MPAVLSDDDARRRSFRRGLVVLTLINLFNYLDRYVISGLAETLMSPRGLSLTGTQTGLLVPGFIVVYAITSIGVGWLGDRFSRPKTIALGVAVWSLATAVGGFAGGFLSLLLARSLVGVGEGTYGTIAPGLLADYFPKSQRGRVFSVFFAAIFVGSALGFVLGGWADDHWRAAFFIAGLPGLGLAALSLKLPDPPRGSQDDPADLASVHGAIPRGFRVYAPLLRNRPYLWTVVGYAAATFAAGGLAFWMPTFLEVARGAKKSASTIQFGAITAVTGLVGTYVGGMLGDRLLRRTRHAYLWFSGVTTLAAWPLVWVALTAHSEPVYLGAIVLGELLLFASTGPVNSAIVNFVAPEHRAAAVALSILAIHLLGDVPSPVLIGHIYDVLTVAGDPASKANALGRAVLVVPVAVAVAGLIWTVAAWRSERADRRRRDAMPAV